MKRWNWKLAVVLALSSAAALGAWSIQQKAAPAASLSSSSVRWILDAGHGGEDGGAVSPSGAVESQINLEIARRVDAILGFCGEPALLLRQSDVSLHDPDAVTLREKKSSDLHNRAQAAQSNPDATLVSIHQNMFSQSQYRGAQVFYAPTPGSQELAQTLQSALRESLQPDNTRECKPIPDTVYLMNHVPNRAVLVECGFLSNPEEEQALQDPGYQIQLAAVVAAGCLACGDT